MTEYEIADLALSNAEAIRSQTALIIQNSARMQNGIVLFYSLLFAYVTAAYLVGSTITKVQVAALNILFLSVMIMNRLAWYQNMMSGRQLKHGLRQLQDVAPLSEATAQFGLETAISIHAFLVITSFFFMWSVRHPRTE